MSGLPDFFSEATKTWFQSTLGEPTRVQTEAWPRIFEGRDTLVSAPTGTGKTLTAFLVFLDRMMQQAKKGELPDCLQLIYISPLKSLAADIRENLKRPLNGILREEIHLKNNHLSEAETEETDDSEDYDGVLSAAVKGDTGVLSKIRVGIRTGDTTSSERQSMLKKPPHILITTPESLYLLLTGKGGRQMLSTANAIILDELHAVMETKRGAHLLFSLARLDVLHQTPLQRIGLSATVKPLSVAAAYLSPGDVAVVAPAMTKKVEIKVLSPKRELQTLSKDSVWRDIAARLYEESCQARTSIAFVDGRKFAEQLAFYLSEFGGEDYARVHHGSLSKEKRHLVETDLKNGRIRLLIATSTMELGIDVGEIDRVFQIGQPRTISGTMQRLGRAGHSPTKTSVMQIFPRTAEEALYCGMTAEVARNGGIEDAKPPTKCYDVLAQHLVSMAAAGEYTVEEVLPICKRAYPFTDITADEIRGILRMLSGDYEHAENIPVRPRLLYDRIHDTVEGDTYSRMLSVASGGTIPDRGMFAVKTEAGVKVGEVEEEFVFESRVGDDFLLGSYSWKVQKITKDTVVVVPSPVKKARLPFWKGEIVGRKKMTGEAFGAILRRLETAYHAGDRQLSDELFSLGLDEPSVLDVKEYMERQITATEVMPSDKTIILEHFRDETGCYQIMFHSVFGNRVNTPLAILLQEHAQEITGSTVNYVANDDGINLFPYDGKRLPQGLLNGLSPERAEGMLKALVLGTPTFTIVFRYNAGRALMMGVKSFHRQPLWVQRTKGAEMLNSLLNGNSIVEEAFQNGEEHPLLAETKRECLYDYWDIAGVVDVLLKIRSGEIKVRELYLEQPSPMSFILRKKTEESQMYSYAPTPTGVIRTMEQRVQAEKNLLIPEENELKRVQERKKLPEDEKQLHSLLMMEGDLQAGELPVPIEWLETLLSREQVTYVAPGLWIAAEQLQLYQKAFADPEEFTVSLEERFAARQKIVLRLLRFRGAFSVSELCARYLLSEQEAEAILKALLSEEKLTLYNDAYYHRELFERARTETVKGRRELSKTEPFSHYAAYLLSQRKELSTPLEQLSEAIRKLCGMPFLPELWEKVILPGRVNGYREELLDRVLSQGEFYWRMNEKQELLFEEYENADFDAPFESLLSSGTVLTEREQRICSIIKNRGASFLTAFTKAFDGEPPYDEIMSLTEKGVLCTDSFGPVRYYLRREAVGKMTGKQKAAARVKLLSLGRFDFARKKKELSPEQKVDRLLWQTGILCRETIKGRMDFSEALEVLRIYEYTGRVRRGYFVEGLSGIQFIAEQNYTRILSQLQHPEGELTWVNAADPAQVYGKLCPHREGMGFLNVPGTVAAFYDGQPVAVFERTGKVFRCFEEKKCREAVSLFKKCFEQKSVFPEEKRLLVKEYPAFAAEVFQAAGFQNEMNDWVLYR